MLTWSYLWDDGEVGPEVVEADLERVHAVHLDAARTRLHQTQQRQQQAATQTQPRSAHPLAGPYAPAG